MQVFTIPNILSMLRICMIPVFIYTHINGHPVATGVLIILSGATDVLDGYIARTFNQISKLGKVLDPIADKLTQGSVVLMLCFTYYEMIPLFVVLAAKELWMGVMGLRLLGRGQEPFGALWWGKLSTFCLYGYMIAMVFAGGMIPMPIRITLVCLVGVVLLMSMVRYAPFFKAK